MKKFPEICSGKGSSGRIECLGRRPDELKGSRVVDRPLGKIGIARYPHGRSDQGQIAVGAAGG